MGELLDRGRQLTRELKRELDFYRCVLGRQETPWLARVCLGTALAYALSPVDIVPDWLPGAGHRDDLIIVPILIYAGTKLVPREIINECRNRTRRSHTLSDRCRAG